MKKTAIIICAIAALTMAVSSKVVRRTLNILQRYVRKNDTITQEAMEFA